MTLNELKNKTAEIKGQIDYKTLSEGVSSTYKILAEKKVEGAEITVLENGYVLYQSDGRVTAFHLKECSGYEYHTVDGDTLSISREELGEMEWSVPVLLTGERRISSNRMKYQKRMEVHESAFHNGGEESDENLMLKLIRGNMYGVEKSSEDILLEQERIEELMSCLTDRQKDFVQKMYLEGKTLMEIAEEENLNYRSLIRVHDRILERISLFIRKENIF